MPTPGNAYAEHVHARFRHRRERTIAHLDSAAYAARRSESHAAAERLEKLRDALRGCCAAATIRFDAETGGIAISEASCRSRHCPRCGARRLAKVKHQLGPITEKIDDSRFLTLTQQHTDAPLSEQLKHLRRSFARLRRSPIWRERVKGGVYTVEITYNAKTDRWHPHLHAILDGDYLPQERLRDAWKIANPGSEIVWIARVPNRRTLRHYLTNYITKGFRTDEIPLQRLAEWTEALHGCRLMQTFGSLHGLDVNDEADVEFPRNTEHLLNANWLLYSVAQDDPLAVRTWNALQELTKDQPYAFPNLTDENDTNYFADLVSSMKRIADRWWHAKTVHQVPTPFDLPPPEPPPPPELKLIPEPNGPLPTDSLRLRW